MKLLLKNCFRSPLSISHTASHALLTHEMHISISHESLECVLGPSSAHSILLLWSFVCWRRAQLFQFAEKVKARYKWCSLMLFTCMLHVIKPLVSNK